MMCAQKIKKDKLTLKSGDKFTNLNSRRNIENDNIYE